MCSFAQGHPADALASSYASSQPIDTAPDGRWLGPDGGRLDWAITRIDQRFTLTNRLFGHWAVQTGLHIEHEFETEPGFEPTDTRLDVSLLYGF